MHHTLQDMKTGGGGSIFSQPGDSAGQRAHSRGADADNPTLTINKGPNTAHTGVTRHSASSEDATYTLHTRGASPATGEVFSTFFRFAWKSLGAGSMPVLSP